MKTAAEYVLPLFEESYRQVENSVINLIRLTTHDSDVVRAWMPLQDDHFWEAYYKIKDVLEDEKKLFSQIPWVLTDYEMIFECEMEKTLEDYLYESGRADLAFAASQETAIALRSLPSLLEACKITNDNEGAAWIEKLAPARYLAFVIAFCHKQMSWLFTQSLTSDMLMTLDILSDGAKDRALQCLNELRVCAYQTFLRPAVARAGFYITAEYDKKKQRGRTDESTGPDPTGP